MLYIHQLDKLSYSSEEKEKALEEYQDALLKQFTDSPEGQARLQADPEMGFWITSLIRYGYNYVGVTLPKMNVAQFKEVVTELFPSKISLPSPDDADDAIPELIAFWQYLKRVYNLSNADAILNFLHQIEPDFKGIMNDPSKFGMAKSFFMAGQAAGFDMTNKRDIDKFMLLYNANILSQKAKLPSPLEHREFIPLSSNPKNRMSNSKKKRLRKMAEASRKKNRKKRK